MAEIVVILGVQAVVIGTIGGLNYSNNSKGYASWAEWTWTTNKEQTHDAGDTELSQEPPTIVVHRKRPNNAMKAPSPTAPALRDFDWHFTEQMEFAYE